MDSILKRRSVRKFDLTKKIAYGDLVLLCEYAEAAPSARNQQGREYVIVDDEKIIEQLAGVSAGAKLLSGCNTVIAVIAKNPSLLPTPSMQPQDLACAVENILIKATDMGFGSCYIGISPEPLRTEACDKILKINDELTHTFALIALGYPLGDDVFYDKKKFNPELIHHNRY